MVYVVRTAEISACMRPMDDDQSLHCLGTLPWVLGESCVTWATSNFREQAKYNDPIAGAVTKWKAGLQQIIQLPPREPHEIQCQRKW